MILKMWRQGSGSSFLINTASKATNSAKKRISIAIASLVNGIVWTFVFLTTRVNFGLGYILALIFGYRALSQIKKDPSIGGRGMAIAGVVLGWIGVGIQLLAMATNRGI